MYTPEHDVTDQYSDGTGVKLLFKAGTPIAWATALELGLVTGDPPTVEAPKHTSRLMTRNFDDDADNSQR